MKTEEKDKDLRPTRLALGPGISDSLTGRLREDLSEGLRNYVRANTPEGEAWVTERLLWLLCGDVGHVIAAIRRTATRRGLSRKARRPADLCADYLERHRAFLHDDDYLAHGLPIATGVIEGACRHLIRDRLTLTGARWSLEGAEAILRLRSLKASGDWDAYWPYHERQELQRNHAARYANDVIPTLTPPSRSTKRGTSHLRVVK